MCLGMNLFLFILLCIFCVSYNYTLKSTILENSQPLTLQILSLLYFLVSLSGILIRPILDLFIPFLLTYHIFHFSASVLHSVISSNPSSSSLLLSLAASNLLFNQATEVFIPTFFTSRYSNCVFFPGHT